VPWRQFLRGMQYSLLGCGWYSIDALHARQTRFEVDVGAMACASPALCVIIFSILRHTFKLGNFYLFIIYQSNEIIKKCNFKNHLRAKCNACTLAIRRQGGMHCDNKRHNMMK
jgi:hypothetical protein